MLQHNIFFPATVKQTTYILTENDCPRFGIQGDTDTPQLSPLDEEPRVLLNKLAIVEATDDYTEDSTIESNDLQLSP